MRIHTDLAPFFAKALAAQIVAAGETAKAAGAEALDIPATVFAQALDDAAKAKLDADIAAAEAAKAAAPAAAPAGAKTTDGAKSGDSGKASK